MTHIQQKIKLCFLLISLVLIAGNTYSQDCRMQVSLLTCSPGEELYSSFGHSALRIVDSSANRDLVFNYGTFDFSEKNFYMKFIRGKLKYFISIEDFNSFEYQYRLENRSITEQIIDLTCEEKEKLKAYLQWNLLPANRYYKYDFTFDNCTTRLADLLENATSDSIKYGIVINHPTSFRNAIHEYLNNGQKYWSKLGIDILLGSRLDRKMTGKEPMFLPDNLMKAVDSATLNGRNLSSEKERILKREYVPTSNGNTSTPIFIFTCLFVIIAFLSFSNNTKVEQFLASLDGVFFFVNGLLGLVLVFMWVGTDHYMTKDNLNLLGAWPINIVAAFFVHSDRRWPKIYFVIFAIAQILLLLFWFSLPQKMNIALIPITGILIFRSFLYKPLNKRLHAKIKIQK